MQWTSDVFFAGIDPDGKPLIRGDGALGMLGVMDLEVWPSLILACRT